MEIKKGFVTNATANSVAFYAMAFLNNQGLTPSQIKRMREKFELEDLHEKEFSQEELKKCFLTQSVYFLNLYTYMNEDDRFKNFAENPLHQKLYDSLFRRYKNSTGLLDDYSREIFHGALGCEYMRSPYEDEERSLYFANTGVFAEQVELEKPSYYIIDVEWLEKIGMRHCKICSGSAPARTLVSSLFD